MTDEQVSRRDFFKQGVAALSVAALAEQVIAQTSSASATGLPTRVLGRTGQRVSILCLGGWHIGAVKDENEAIRIMHAALDQGINFFDNCWDYHGGRAEEVMGKALAMDGKRKQVFLMTKNCERDYAGSMKNLEDSLRRLRTDYLDLWQFHEIVYDNDPDWVFEKGGIKAAIEARKQGKVRYIGFTGHKDPLIHLKMLAKPFDWDTAQMPINVMDAHYRSFQKEVVPECLKKNVGVIGMKGLGGGGTQGRLVAAAGLTPQECYRYCLSLPVASQVVGMISMEQLKQNIAIARDFRPMTSTEREALLARVKEEAGDGRHELFKSTKNFDGPHHRRQHGFDVG
ncbi:MAG: aldo/keto reductase [Bryobacteraceae bacterium]|nr:aldo/keto reductase [Bryobacteraceae bacterium]